MAAYTIDPLALRQATLLTLVDRHLLTDAMFIHGSCVRDDGLDDSILAVGHKLYESGQVGSLVINGLTDAVCVEKNLAYPGGDTWEKKLRAKGIKNLLKIKPSPHTPAECRNMIALAQKEEWRRLTVAAFPHHILRVMCQWIYLLKELGSPISVYARTMDTVDWTMPAKKPVLGGGTVEGTLFDHMGHELNQLALYSDLDCFETPEGKRIPASLAGPEDKQKYTPNATLEELIAYYKWRDR